MKNCDNCKTYTLLSWASIPEENDFYVIPDEEITETQRTLLAKAHNRLINNDDMNEGMDFLNNALCEEKKHCGDDVPDVWKCCWAKYKHDMSNPVVCRISHAYFSGFIL